MRTSSIRASEANDFVQELDFKVSPMDRSDSEVSAAEKLDTVAGDGIVLAASKEELPKFIEDEEVTVTNTRAAIKKKKRVWVPARPFQAPPTIIDCTPDVLFDHNKWMPLLPAVRRDRWPGPEEKYQYQFDREQLDKQVFDPF